jgi:histidinol-phosphatase (PHP family)
VDQGWTPQTLAANFDAFVAEAKRLRDTTDRPRILIGLETEMLSPEDPQRIRNLQQRHQLDYIVGSVHHVHATPIDFDKATYERIESALGWDALCSAYFDAQYELILAVNPIVIGHVDLVRMWYPDRPLHANVWVKIQRNVRAVNAYGGLFEVNSRGWKKSSSGYPLPDTLRVILELGGRVTLSDDAHGPNDVAMHYDKVRAYLINAGVQPLHVLDRADDGSIAVKPLPEWSQHAFWNQFDAPQ